MLRGEGEGGVPRMRLKTETEETPMSAVRFGWPRILLFANNFSRFDTSKGVGMLFNGFGSRFSSKRFDSIKEARCLLILINTALFTHLPLHTPSSSDGTYSSIRDAGVLISIE